MSTPTDSNPGLDPHVAGFANGSPLQGTSPAEVAADATDPDNPPWGILPAVGVMIASAVLMFVLQILFVVPYALSFKTADPQALRKIFEGDKTVILLSLVAIIPAHLLTLALAWAVVTSFGKRPFWRTLGWGWSTRYGRAEALACVALVGLLWLTGVLLLRVFGDRETDLERWIMSSQAARYTIAALATFTAPLVEEVVFRGVLYAGMRRWLFWLAGAASRLFVWKGWLAREPRPEFLGKASTALTVIVVVLVFAAIHVPQYLPNVAAIATILILSSVLTVVRARTRRLLPCVLIHFLFNGLNSVLILLSPSRETLSPPSPGPIPPEPGAVMDALRAALSLLS